MNNPTSIRRWHWLTSVFFFILAVATLVFALANSGTRVSAQVTPSAPIYTAGSFTFSTPLALVHPPLNNPLLKDQDVEPEIKVDIFGNIYVTAIHGTPGGVDFWKSIDKGASFVYMGEPDGAQDKCNVPNQPLCTAGLGGGDDSIDVSNGGYLYVSSLFGAPPTVSVTLSASYDGGTGGVVPGQKWEVNPASNGIPIDDRQWIAAYGPQTVYMIFDQAPLNTTIWFVKSTDAGKTWSAPTSLIATATLSRVNNLAVDQYNGNIYTTYTPAGSPNQINLLRSTDSGATWTTITAYTGPGGTSVENAFPILTVDRGGNLHVVFTRTNGAGRSNAHVFLISSSDAGATWTSPIQVDSGAANNCTVMPWAVAGSAGVVDITWYGSTMNSPNNTPANQNEWWNVFFAQVTNALSASPTIAQNQVASKVHNLPICSAGGGCSGNTRDLAEYYAMTIDPDGNANITYVDEVNYCAAHPSTNCLAHVYYAKQTGGPSAYAPPAGPAAATFAANLTLPNSTNCGSSGCAEPNMKVDSHNCLFSAAPGPPDGWRSTNAGASFSLLPNPVTSAGGIAGGGDSDILSFPQASGARPDQLYYADLAVASVNISKSTDGGATWFSPGMNGAAGEVSVVTDRQWMAADRNGANQTVYLWEHEFVGQELRMNALTNDTVWAPFASGMTDPELIAPPGSTLANTVPGPMFVDPATHRVYGFLGASTVTTNAIGAPAGKLPNVWEADGAGTFTSGVPPGPFTNHPVFKGPIDSPTAPAPPAGSATVGSNTANLFNGATIDSAGNIYVSWSTPSARNGLYDVWFASSHDHGQTYYGPFKINPNGVQGNMPWIAAGDNGRVDIVYYGTTGTQDPTTSSTNQWNVFFAQSLNAADREPVFTVSQASDHITHTGPICNVGILCSSGTRQLLDFFQVAIGPDGLANIAYADTGNSNGASHISYARQSGGPLALANPSSVTCIPIPVLTGVVSRKTHTGLTPPGDLPLALTGTVTIEPRSGGIPSGNHTLVFTFTNPLTSVTGNTTTATTSGGTSSVTCSGSIGTDTHQYILNCTGVPNASHLNVTLNGVTDSVPSTGNISVKMDVLFGDVSASGRTDAGDVTQVRNRTVSIPDTTNPASFRYDVNISGRIDAGDVTATRNATVTVLP